MADCHLTALNITQGSFFFLLQRDITLATYLLNIYPEYHDRQNCVGEKSGISLPAGHQNSVIIFGRPAIYFYIRPLICQRFGLGLPE